MYIANSGSVVGINLINGTTKHQWCFENDILCYRSKEGSNSWGGWIHPYDIRKITFTGTTSSAGNISYTFPLDVVVLAAYAQEDACIVLPYSAQSNPQKWWFHCVSDSAQSSVKASTTVHLTVLWMDLGYLIR